MRDFDYEHETLLNGACVSVLVHVTFDIDWEGTTEASFNLGAVYFDGVDVSPVLDKDTLTALEMEAESVIADSRSDIPSHLPTF
jgi:hypothetical protein